MGELSRKRGSLGEFRIKDYGKLDREGSAGLGFLPTVIDRPAGHRHRCLHLAGLQERDAIGVGGDEGVLLTAGCRGALKPIAARDARGTPTNPAQTTDAQRGDFGTGL